MPNTDKNSIIIDNDGFYGRADIFTAYEEITEENVLTAVNEALSYHVRNLGQEDQLYWYRRGVMPILSRTKRRNTYVNNKVVDNVAETVASFKEGYFLTQPAYYIARNTDAQDRVLKLNEFLYRSGKAKADNRTVNWFCTVGKGVIYVESNDDPEVPFKAYALDPRKAFTVYSINPGNRPIMGVNAVTVGDRLLVDVYTRTRVFRLAGATAIRTTSSATYPVSMIASMIVNVENNPLGEIPIIEYRYNAQNQASFEAAYGLINTKNTILSNQADGVEQFIQSLMVFYNADLPEGEDANSLREKGILLLKSIGEQKSEVKILSEQLNQEQTLKLVEYIDEQILTICQMPCIQFGQTSSSDNQGAVLARNGWFHAEASARNTEDEFKRSNEQFDRIIAKILRDKGILEISPSDFELQFVRNEQSNIQSKAQAYSTLVQGGLAPVLALAKSGVSNDPESDYKISEPWIRMKIGNPDAPTEEVDNASAVR